eukprot:9671316-Ditylum_brightwellii.AAC.1
MHLVHLLAQMGPMVPALPLLRPPLACQDKEGLFCLPQPSLPQFAQFVEAIVKQINGHSKKGHWELVIMQDVPK